MPRFLDSIRFALCFSLRSFTDQAVNALLAARKHAVERRRHDITPEDVLFGMAALLRCSARVALRNLGLDLAREAAAVTALADAHPPSQSYRPPALAPATERLLSRAKEHAGRLGLNYVGTEHVVLGLLGETGLASDYLRERGITPNRFFAELQNLLAGDYEQHSSD
jgi:ATP-dependent Clp protease ATP-binding subunit ClpC